MKSRDWESNQGTDDWVRLDREEDWREEKGDFDAETVKEEHLGRKSVVCWPVGQERSWREELRCSTWNWEEKHRWDGNLCCLVREEWEHFDRKHQVFDKFKGENGKDCFFCNGIGMRD